MFRTRGARIIHSLICASGTVLSVFGEIKVNKIQFPWAGPTALLWGPGQNNNAEPLVQKVLGISGQ